MIHDLDAHWEELVTAALLGAERRDPPPPPPGPVADAVADAVRSGPAARMLVDVAVTAAVRRAAFLPGPPADVLAPPLPDPRPECSPEATASWRHVRAEWPVLEDEWVSAVVTLGRRLPADVTVALLQAHRRDPVRHARVRRAAGPLADWLLDHVPSLAPPRPGRRTDQPSPDALPPDAPAALPALPVSPELSPLLDVDAATFVRGLLPAFHDGRMGASHRPVLVNLLARCRVEVLQPASDALASVDAGSPAGLLAHQLADLAHTRASMLAALE